MSSCLSRFETLLYAIGNCQLETSCHQGLFSAADITNAIFTQKITDKNVLSFFCNPPARPWYYGKCLGDGPNFKPYFNMH